MDPDSIPWTAFWVPDGLFEWLVMPFGLKNAPAVFQRKMDNCFKGTEDFIAVYIDDILVYSETEEHREHLKILLKICKKKGLILSPTKMKIGSSNIEFLGATIGNSKIKLQSHIISKVANFSKEELQTTKGLRSWLGILNYTRSYIPNLGKILGPLYSKTSPNGEKRMNSQDWALVDKIKTMIKDLPNLAIPPTNCYVIIESDGCPWTLSNEDELIIQQWEEAIQQLQAKPSIKAASYLENLITFWLNTKKSPVAAAHGYALPMKKMPEDIILFCNYRAPSSTWWTHHHETTEREHTPNSGTSSTLRSLKFSRTCTGTRCVFCNELTRGLYRKEKEKDRDELSAHVGLIITHEYPYLFFFLIPLQALQHILQALQLRLDSLSFGRLPEAQSM
ncbi:hypothetical protein ZIOFF_029791 [Zingiber officinale]|uniref:Reverse transcriptase domain-containing protein n=1 Tax=Zingiber officinale TaxID=94328 RepID=A0A8J5H229_ZINOF|nr:hypothetical protein ZIOFF_029791 [Zingiber officinale]